MDREFKIGMVVLLKKKNPLWELCKRMPNQFLIIDVYKTPNRCEMTLLAYVESMGGVIQWVSPGYIKKIVFK